MPLGRRGWLCQGDSLGRHLSRQTAQSCSIVLHDLVHHQLLEDAKLLANAAQSPNLADTRKRVQGEEEGLEIKDDTKSPPRPPQHKHTGPVQPPAGYPC